MSVEHVWADLWNFMNGKIGGKFPCYRKVQCHGDIESREPQRKLRSHSDELVFSTKYLISIFLYYNEVKVFM